MGLAVRLVSCYQGSLDLVRDEVGVVTPANGGLTGMVTTVKSTMVFQGAVSYGFELKFENWS